VKVVAREFGIGVLTLQRWREDVQSMPARGRAWTAGARLEAVITAAAMDEVGKSAWCRESGVYLAELDKPIYNCSHSAGIVTILLPTTLCGGSGSLIESSFTFPE